MTNKKTFLQTATLIEDILGVKKVSYWFPHFTEKPRDACGTCPAFPKLAEDDGASTWLSLKYSWYFKGRKQIPYKFLFHPCLLIALQIF